MVPSDDTKGHKDRFLPLNGLHIVVVDDNVDARDMVTLALTKQGGRVIATDSAAEARNIFGYVRPDVLVCDLAMSRETGLTLIQWIRRLPPEDGGTVRALALTAFRETYGKARALTAGFDEYATKPIDPLGAVPPRRENGRASAVTALDHSVRHPSLH